MLHETQSDIGEEITLAVDSVRESLPDSLKRDIANCRQDLFFGPLYFDADGNECCCFDEGAKGFDFVGAARRIREWVDSIDEIRIETAYDDETGESAYEPVDGSAREIARRILGRELLATL